MSGPEFIGDIIENPSQARAKLILIVECRTKWAFYKKVQNEYIRLDPLSEFVFSDPQRNLTGVVDNCQVIVYKGPHPERGCPGTPGPRGFPGTPGLDGVSGTSGSDGNSGIPGSPGKRGLIGLEGEQGFPGLKGVSGKSGLSGRPGLNGAIRRGSRGVPGTQGPRGDRGLSGGQGLIGFPGDFGVPGSPGSPGPSGYPGLPGSLGITGPRGPSGSPGLSGAQGPSGMSGLQGVLGQTGLSGLPGLSGISGFPGLSGISGSPGLSGISGLSGFPGPSGSSGSSGQKGSPGAPGIPGRVGDRGLPGYPGQVGSPGRNGTPASPGEPGSPGKVGEKGLPGTPGEPGRNGIQGDSGPRGAPGITLNGVPGTNGLSGGNGISGSPGQTGPSGPSGAPGIRGPSGSRGAPGNRGPSGSSGPPGMSAGREFAFGYVWSEIDSSQVLNPYISNSFPAPTGTVVNFDESLVDNLSFNGNSLTIQEDGYYQARYVVNPSNPFSQLPATFPFPGRTNGASGTGTSDSVSFYGLNAGNSIYVCCVLQSGVTISTITDNGIPPNTYVKATSYSTGELSNEIWYTDNINLPSSNPLTISFTTSDSGPYNFNALQIVGANRTNSLGNIASPYSGTVTNGGMNDVSINLLTPILGELGLMSIASYSQPYTLKPFTASGNTTMQNFFFYSNNQIASAGATGNPGANSTLTMTVVPNFNGVGSGTADVTAVGVAILPQTVSNEPDLLSLQLLKNGQPIPGSRNFKNLITSPTPVIGATANSSNNAASSESQTVSISPKDGSSIYVTIQANGSETYNGYVQSVSDGINTYRQAQNYIRNANQILQNTIWYADNIQTNGSSLTVTVTFSSPIEFYVELTEVIGANKTDSFDSASQYYLGASFGGSVTIAIPNNFSNELGLVSVIGYSPANSGQAAYEITSITCPVVSGHVINQIYNTTQTTNSLYLGLVNVWGNLNQNSSFTLNFNPGTNDYIGYAIFGLSIIPESSQYENIGQLVGGAIFEAESGDVIQLANNRIEDTYLQNYILPVPQVVNTASVSGDTYIPSTLVNTYINVVQGNSIYVCIEVYDSDTTPNPSISNSQGKPFTQAGRQIYSLESGSISVYIYYVDNLNTANPLTITVTFTSSTIVNYSVQTYEIFGADPNGSFDGTIATSSASQEYDNQSTVNLIPPSSSGYDLGLIGISFLEQTFAQANANYISPNPNVLFLNSNPGNVSLLASGYGNLSSSTLGGTVYSGSDRLYLVVLAVSIKPAPVNNLNNASLELVLLP